MKIKKLMAASFLISMMLPLVLCGCKKESFFQSKEGTSLTITSEKEGSKEEGHSSIKDDGSSKDTDVSEDHLSPDEGIYVQVSGAVVSPGVYHLKEGARVFEVIAMAGGIREDADDSNLNQASVMSDGQMIHVPTAGEAQEQREAEKESDLVNINTADAEKLQTLSGIGENKAKAIVSYREEHGPFARTEDIMNIPGIKEGAYNRFKDQITVN